MMFLISEVHPFTDGNGRIARVMANAELVSAGQTRVFIPVVYRTDYMGALRELTRSRRPDILLRMMNRAQTFVHEIAFDDLSAAEEQLRRCNAFRESDEARLRLPSESQPVPGGEWT
jgi:Fic family protein